MKYQCPCCEYYTLDEPINCTYNICPVCFWEDDGWDVPDVAGGANKVSLNEAKNNFREFGASELRFKKYVRAALEEEKTQNNT